MDAKIIALQHAALSGSFEPRRFLYPAGSDGKDRSAVLRELAIHCEEVVAETKRKGPRLIWAMRHADRTRYLRSLIQQPKLMKRRWRKRPPLTDDVFGQVLRDCLIGEPPAAEAVEVTSLRDAISAANFAAPLLTDAEREVVEAFEADLYRRAVEASQNARRHAVLPGQLCGRADELAAILAFLARGEVIAPLIRLMDLPETRPAERLLLKGTPGVGKSAFLTELGRALKAEGFTHWIVTLDFDQLTLTQGSSMAWSEELTRQIGNQAPSLAGPLSALRARHSRERRGMTMASLDIAARRFLDETLPIIGQAPPRTLIIFADTIEEIMARDASDRFRNRPDDTVFKQLLDWLSPAMNCAVPVFSDLRMVLSGRVEPPVESLVLREWFDAKLDLTELDQDAAKRLLAQFENPLPEEDRRRVVRAVGGHPLHLTLVHKHLSGCSESERREELDEITQDDLRTMTSEAVLRTLYSRFLNRIRVKDLGHGLTMEDVKRLAHPGLLLRYLTPELLSRVVAPAAGVTFSGSEAEQEAYHALTEQIWLVTVGDVPGSIRHRPDVRRVMLKMMLSDTDPRIDAVLGAGIRWHENHESPDEAGYLAALKGDTASFVDDSSLAASVLSLAGEDIEVMPKAAQAILKWHSSEGIELTEEEIEALPETLRFGTMVKQQSGAIKATGSRGPQGLRAALETEGGDQPAKSAPRGTGDLDWLPNNAEFQDVLNDTRLHDTIEIAFSEARFEDAARIGWEALSRVRRWLDFSYALTTRVPFEERWLWRLSLASLVAHRSSVAEDVLNRIAPDRWVAERLGMDRPQNTFEAGFDLAALWSMASGPQPSVAKISWTEDSENLDIRDFRTLRLWSANPILRGALTATGAPPVTILKMTLGVPYLHPIFDAADDSQTAKIHMTLDVKKSERVEEHDLEQQIADIWTQDDPGKAGDDIAGRVDLLSLKASRLYQFAFNLPEQPAVAGSILQACLRGQTPELHPTMKGILTSLPEASVVAALERVSAMTRFWPTGRHAFGASGGEQSARLAQSLKGRRGAAEAERIVRFLDLCGLLGAFLDALAEVEDGRQDIAATGNLFWAMDRHFGPLPESPAGTS